MKHDLMKRFFVGMLFLSVSAVSHAMPMAYDFQYDFINGESLTGMLEGELQADLETVLVSNVLGVSYSGDTSLIFGALGSTPENVATLSGVGMDLFVGGFASPTPDGTLYLSNLPTVVLRENFPNGIAYVVDQRANIVVLSFDTFRPGNWTMTARASVPLGAVQLYFLTALAGLYGARRFHNGRC